MIPENAITEWRSTVPFFFGTKKTTRDSGLATFF
jgi:hypothetical protein